MKYDAEYQVTLAAKAHLIAALDSAEFVSWPVVAWFDEMAIEPGNRVVVICTSAASKDNSEGNFSCELEVGVRTDWTETTGAAALAEHFSKVQQVRDVLNADVETLSAALAAQCSAGFTVSYVDRQRSYSSDINEGNFYSSIKLSVECHATEE